MKIFSVLVVLFTVPVLSVFAASPACSDSQQLEGLLQGRSLVCRPVKGVPADMKSSSRGDRGYFAVAIRKGEVRVTGNGGMGYGFGNGSVLNLIVRNTQMILEVGDDGYQSLIFDFSNRGVSSEFPDRCGEAVLLSYPSSFTGADRLVCCH